MVLIDNITKEMACVIEKELIEQYKTQNKKYGYNLASGGFGGCTSKGERHFLSKKVYQYSLDGVFIKEWENAQRASEELDVCVSDIHAMCRGVNGIRKAGSYMWSYIKYDSLEPYVREGSSKEPILQIDKSFNVISEYKNISYVDKNLFNKEKVTNCCKRKSLTHNGYYWAYKTDFDSSFEEYVKIKHNSRCYARKTCKPIAQCDLDGNIIKIFNSSKQVEDEIGLNRSTVQAYCKREEMNSGRKTGFIWRYT